MTDNDRDYSGQSGARPRHRQRRAAELLAAGRTFSEVAREVGIDRRTLHRWRSRPAFAAELNRVARELDNEAREALRAGRGEALRYLREVLGSPTAKDAVKVAAARALLGAAPLALPDPGPANPEEVRRAERAAEDERLTAAAMAASTREVMRSLFRGGA